MRLHHRAQARLGGGEGGGMFKAGFEGLGVEDRAFSSAVFMLCASLWASVGRLSVRRLTQITIEHHSPHDATG